MVSYYLRLAWLSVKKTPVLSALMVLAIAMGIAACLTTLTLYQVVSSNPLADKNAVTFAVQLDSWDPNEDYWAVNGVPEQLTYQDAKAIYRTGNTDQTVLTSRVMVTVEATDASTPPKVEDARLATRDFFSVFDVPFRYGGPWSVTADTHGEQQVVISTALQHHFFAGENPIGKSVMVEGEVYTIVGVMDERWTMTPSVYDLNSGAFKNPPQLFLPFFNVERRPFASGGNIVGWKNEDVRSHQDFLATEMAWVQTWVSLNAPEARAEFEQFLVNYIHNEKQKGRFERPLKYYLNTPEQWLSINGVVSRDNRILVYLSLAFLAVCLVNAVVLLLAKFLRKAPEAGLRRALGASRAAVFVQHLAEAAVIGALGSALGLLLSWFGLVGVRSLYSHYQEVAVMSGFTVIAALVFALVCALVSGALPAWQVSRSQPARYLKAQ